MTMRRGGFEAAPARRPAVGPHHIRFCARFINKDKALGVQIGLARTPFLARLRDIGPVLLCGAQGLFLSVSPRCRSLFQRQPMLTLMPRFSMSQAWRSASVASGSLVTWAQRASSCA